ncbi:MAG: TolC family protein [Nitrospirota bacterium]
MKRVGTALWLVIVLAASGTEPSFGARDEPATVLTVDRAVELALERNMDVLVSRFGLDRAEANRLLAAAYPNPEYWFNQEGLSAGFEREANNVRYHRIEQVIEGFGKRRHRAAAGEAGVEEARAEFQDTVRLLIFELRKTFYEVLLTQANAETAAANLQRFREVVAITESRFEQGEIPEADVIRTRVEALRFEDDARSAGVVLATAKSRLALLIGLDGPVEVQGSLERDLDQLLAEPVSSADRLVERALAARPDLAAVQASQRRAESEMRRNRALRYPDLTVGLESEYSAGVQGADDLSTFGFGLGVTLPIWNRNRGGIALAQADLRQAETRVQQQERVIRAEIETGLEQLRVSAERVRAVRSQLLPQSQESLTIAKALYEEGATGLLQLLDAQRAFNETQLRAHQILFEYHVNRWLLERAVGAELVTLGAAP